MCHYPLPSHSGTVCPSIHPFIRPSICIQPDRHTSQPIPPFCCGVPTAQEKCMLFGPVLPFTPVQTLFPSSLMTIEQPALSPIATAQSVSRQAWPLSTRHQRTCFYRFFFQYFYSSSHIILYSHSASMLHRGPALFGKKKKDSSTVSCYCISSETAGQILLKLVWDVPLVV